METRHETHAGMKEPSVYMRAELYLMPARTHVAMRPDMKLSE